MKSVMQHMFSRVPTVNIPRSSFNRSHGVKTTFDASGLIPVYVDEALPGDTFNMNMYGFARMSTPLYPIMDNLYLETFFFSVPIWQIWDNFFKFMGERDNPADSIDYLVPTMTSPVTTGYGEMSLSDYLGIPTKVAELEHSSLFHRAYNHIYNEWFRDQNLQDSVVVDKDDGPDDPADYSLLYRGKRHDYFTSCLPWPQKGDAVDLPLGTSAPIIGTITGDGTNAPVFTQGTISDKLRFNSSSVNVNWDAGTPAASGTAYWSDPKLDATGLTADLTSATAATINQLRQAFQIQRLLEKDARGGSRYTEIVRSHFGVSTPDQRLWRPEYLGGGSSRINVTPVAATNKTATAQYMGDLGAYATATLAGHGFTKSFTEHSIIIGLVNVRGDLTYQQGLDRMFSRSTRYDFYWPSLAQIGEQAVLNKEIYAQGVSGGTDDDDIFGYQERYGEYRYKPSKITGLFRSNATAPLDAWHVSQQFSSLPALNSTFITDNLPLDRVIATPAEPHFIFDSYFDLKCARPMPMYGVPGMIDHF